MKQKYEIEISKSENKVVVREFAQLEKELMSLLCEEKFDLAKVKDAIKADDLEMLHASLRSNNMYPPAIYMEGIGDMVVAMLKEKAAGPEEVVFEDLEFLSTYSGQDLEKDIVTLSKDDESLDDLLEPGIEEEFDDTDDLDKINDTLKVDDSEFSDDLE